MQGSPNPLILRNYRMIPPEGFKFRNLSRNSSWYPGLHIPNQEINLVFKVEAAPIVLPYESELVLKFTFLSPKGNEDNKTLSNQWTPGPKYRIRAKSMAHIIKRCWATISNMTFQSYRPPYYLNEILLRKPAHLQMKYPDNYTGEKCAYLDILGANDPAQAATKGTYFKNPSENIGLFIEPLSRTIPNDGQLYFMTPQFSTNTKVFGSDTYYENHLTFRIPLTELLPVFKIGVIPLIMIASNTFDLWIDLYKPADWFLDYGIGQVASLETYLNITTVSFPDINPLAEALIRPRIYDSRFIAPFLDYLTFENSYTLNQSEVDFYFNITQFLRNVPFISISFVDNNVYRPTMPETGMNFYPKHGVSMQKFDDSTLIAANNGAAALLSSNRYVTTGDPQVYPLEPSQRERGGFFSVPPNVTCKDVKIMLGESAFPMTQVPMSWDDMYMYNRKHFEMYGRDFNVYRVSPIGRAYSGDATFFFDLSHSPMAGYTIGPTSPIQITGKLTRGLDDSKITVVVTCYYTNNFNTMLASGGVVPLQ